jgi:glucosyl-3-phosphoglycerate synthase
MRDDVARWTAGRTSASAHWDRRRLAAARDVGVSVVLPARDEAGTVGRIVETVRRELVETVPLVDEVVVVDSGSVDDTATRAREAGAVVVRQGDVVPELGDVPGKGEAMWKALFATSGDVVAYVDADLRDFDAQMVVGLLGPVLADPSVAFVKAFYDRPLRSGETVLPAGGGRVTELVARPLLSLYWPLLQGVVQPLAGEVAARRSLLERIPFVSGYGVEVGMLVDVLELLGLDAMAQVDLGRREHRNSDDYALGRMAAQVQLAVMSRLQAHGRVVLTETPATELVQFVRRDGTFRAVSTDVAIGERPPALDVPQYATVSATGAGRGSR